MRASPHRFRVHALVPAWSIAALLCALLLAGCGGGGGSDGGGSTPPPAPTLTLTASPTTLATGGMITLNWSTTHATSCNASGEWSGSKATSGNQDIAASAAGSPTFTLACTGAGGSVTRSTTVTVNAPPPSGPTLVLSQTTLNVEALTHTTAPTRTITISLVNFGPGDSVYVGGAYSTSGIEAPSLAEGVPGSLVLTIPFRNPTTVGPGSYTDHMSIRACRETPCVNHIAGSPQTITINYIVTANPDPPTVSFNAGAVSVTYDNVGSFGTRTDESIRFSLANRGDASAYTRVTAVGAAVVDGLVLWTGNAQGTVRMILREPGALRAGTYTGKVRVDICHDAACTNPWAGSPGSIDVTYHVTGNALPNTQALWNTSFITGAALVTSETRSPTLKLGLRVTNLPPQGLYVRHTPSTTGLIIGGVNAPPSYISHVATFDSQFDVLLKPPVFLGSGIFSDTMTFEACFDAACTEVVPASRYVFSPSMLIMASEGVEYTRRHVSPGGNAESVVWSPVDRSLYVATSAPNGGTPGIVQVNPVSGAIGPTTPLTVDRLAVTPDGSYLYAGSGSSQTLHRLLLPSLTPDLTIQLGERNPTTPFATSDLDTLPGQPRSVVVAVKVARTGEHAAVRVYDDATPRAVAVGPDSPSTAQRWLVPAADPGQVISWRAGISITSNAVERLSVDAAGIRVDSSLALPMDRYVGGHPVRVGNKLYDAFGRILDATTGDLLGTIPMPGFSPPAAVLPDERHRRLYVWTQVRGIAALVSYDLDTLQILAYAPMQGYSSGSMVLWGDEGIAITWGSSLTVLSGPFFSTYRGEPRQ